MRSRLPLEMFPDTPLASLEQILDIYQCATTEEDLGNQDNESD